MVTLPRWLRQDRAVVPLSLIPPEILSNAEADQYSALLNGAAAGLQGALTPARHESNLAVSPPGTGGAALKPAELYATGSGGTASTLPRLERFRVRHSLAVTRVEHWMEKDEPEFALVRSSDPVELERFPLVVKPLEVYVTGTKPTGRTAQKVEGKPTVVGILKLHPTRTLAEIIDEVGLDRTIRQSNGTAWPGRDLVVDVLPERISRDRGWTGIVFFDVPVELGESAGDNPLKDLKDIDKPGALTLTYLAITPPRTSSAAGGDFGVDAGILWKNGSPSTNTTEEADFSARELELRVLNRSLTSFHFTGEARFRSFFGAALATPRVVGLTGSLDESGEIQMVGSFAPIPLLERPVGLLRQLSLTRLGMGRRAGRTYLIADGIVELRVPDSIPGDWLGMAAGAGKVLFKGLVLVLNAVTSVLRILYETLALAVEGLFSLFDSTRLRLDLVAVRFVPQGRPSDALVELKEWPDAVDDAPHVQFVLRLSLFDLPLVKYAARRLSFDFEFSFHRDDPQIFGIRLALSEAASSDLCIPLLSFARLCVTCAEVVRPGGTPWVFLRGIRLEVMGNTLIKNMVLGFAAPGNGPLGFVVLYHRDVAGKGSATAALLDFEWVMVGRGLELPADVMNALITPDPVDQPSGTQKLASEIKNSVTPAMLACNGATPGSLYGVGSGGGVRTDDWVLGGSLEVFGGALKGKFLFHDNHYYGLSLYGPLLDEIGLKLRIAAAYIPQPPESFYVAVAFPGFAIGALTFTGGVMSVQIWTNGSFLVDLGFPWRRGDGTRDWNRTLGVFVGAVQGSGGMYFQKRLVTGAAPAKVCGVDITGGVEFSAGVAFQWGIGSAFSAGPVSGYASLGITVVVEGRVLLSRTSAGNSLKLHRLTLIGAVGILARAYGELNWWVISVRVEVTAAAEAYCELTLCLVKAQGERTGTLYLAVVAYARVSARACIGKGPFKICKGISVGVRLGIDLTIPL